MEIDTSGVGIIGFITIIGLLTILCVAINNENRTIEQSDNIEKVCIKAYKTDLKNDDEVKKLCKNVKVRIEQLEKEQEASK